MNYNGLYEIGIALGAKKEETDIHPDTYSLTMKDSIWHLYPTLQWDVQDSFGLYQEMSMFTDGMEVTASLGYLGEFLHCPYILQTPIKPVSLSGGSLGGVVQNSLIHRYSERQEIKFHNWYDNISKIVQKLVNNFLFNSVNISTTTNEDYWYQYNLSDSQFIVKQLLPFAWSANSQDTPFFAFIDSANNFHFQDYLTLWDQTPIKAYLQTPSDQVEDGIVVHNLQRVTPGGMFLKQSRKINFHKFNNDGDMDTIETNINSFPSGGEIQKVPLIADLDLLTDTEMLYDDESTSGKKNNNKGLQQFIYRNSLFLEKIVCTTPLNPTILAGKTIELYVYISDNNSAEQISSAVSGKYLIESVSHTWNKGGSKAPQTTFVAGRKNIKIPNNYSIGQRMVSNG